MSFRGFEHCSYRSLIQNPERLSPLAGAQWVTLYWQVFHKMEENCFTSTCSQLFLHQSVMSIFQKLLVSQKKKRRTLQGCSPEKLWPLPPWGVSSHQQKFDRNQAACWALALFGGAEEWMDEATRWKLGGKIHANLDGFFPGCCDYVQCIATVFLDGWWIF